MLSVKSFQKSFLSKKVLFRNMATIPQSDVEFSVRGTTRIINLNRPKKLNALTTQMCDDITPRLVEFSKSKAANLIVIKSNSDKSFCSGGDVIQCAKNNIAGNTEGSVQFFDKEYNLNYLLSIFGKPIVSLVNGIAMGGGVGLSVHGPFRVVCESTRFAMPETSIGFFNDVGTSFWLPKLDGNLGYYLSLTGDGLNGLDSLIAGFGTHYVPSSRFEDLLERLSGLELPQLSTGSRSQIFNRSHEFYSLVNSAIEEFSEDIPKNHKFKFSAEELNTIEKCFNPVKNTTVESVIEALMLDGTEFALKTVKNLQTKSPLSLKLNWALLSKNKDSTMHEALTRELRCSGKLMMNYRLNDFNEYITKNLIEKKLNGLPKSKYESLEKIPETVVDELISLDIYNPQIENGSDESTEKMIETLNQLKISNFSECDEVISNFDIYQHHMGLPTQLEVENYIKGSNESNRQISTTFREAFHYFQMKYDSKSGVSYKVKQILNRKTKPSSYGQEYLEWVD